MSAPTQRIFTRVTFDRKVHLAFLDKKYSSRRIKDLSLTGMFVLGSFQQQEHDICYLILDQKGKASNLRLEASAKVVRRTDEGIAVEFISMAFDSYMFLQSTLLYESGDPIVIGEELPENCPFNILDEKQAQRIAEYSQ